MGAVAHGVSRSINCSQYFLLLLHCVPLYVCRLCINFQELCARLLGMATLRIRFSPSFHALLIDFLSIRKVIIFSAIATDDRHPLRSRSIHQNAANCMTIRFRYIAQSKGVRKTYCARSRNDVRRLTSRSNGMPSKKTMESLEDVRSCRNCSKARPECFKVATKFRSLYLIMLNKEIRSARLVYTRRGLWSFLKHLLLQWSSYRWRNWILDSRSEQDLVQV